MAEFIKILEWLFSKDLNTLMDIVLLISFFSLFKFLYKSLLSDKEKRNIFNDESLEYHIDAQLNLKLYKSNAISKQELLKSLYKTKIYSDIEYLTIVDNICNDEITNVLFNQINSYLVKKIADLKNEQPHSSIENKKKRIGTLLWHSLNKTNINIIVRSLVYCGIIMYSIIIILYILLSSFSMPDVQRSVYIASVVFVISSATIVIIVVEELIINSKIKMFFDYVLGNVIIYIISLLLFNEPFKIKFIFIISPLISLVYSFIILYCFKQNVMLNVFIIKLFQKIKKFNFRGN